jgi:hypothetical protein
MENKIIDTQKQGAAAAMTHYSTCGIVLIHMQMDIAGCACNSKSSKKNDNQLTAKSCSGRSSDDSGRGNGGCGTCGGGNGVDISSGDNDGIDNCDGKGNSDSSQQQQQQRQWQRRLR